MERLLGQLEAKSKGLVPLGCWNELPAPVKRANNGLIAGTLVVIWLSTLALAIAYISYRHSPQVAERVTAATPVRDPVDS